VTALGLAGAWTGGQVTSLARCVLAPNAGPMTLDGTNTWLLLEPGGNQAVVIDPGPADERHLLAVVAAVEAMGARVVQTLLTHRHADHAGGAKRFAELTRAPVRAVDPALRHGDGEGLANGESVEVAGLELRVVGTPGHTSDSLCFLLVEDGAVMTGDTVLGRGTTVIAAPDGRLDDYLESLDRLRELTGSGEIHAVLPGHGPALPDAHAAVSAYLAHRRERLGQVASAVAAGARTAREVVERVYIDVEPSLWPAAEQSVRAQLDFLARHPIE